MHLCYVYVCVCLSVCIEYVFACVLSEKKNKKCCHLLCELNN